MWVPRSWDAILALIGTAEESGTLDFKRGLPPATRPANEEVAKDIAAMSVGGGVILHGIGEDSQTRVATEIRPVVLAGARERFEQIAGTRIAPVCVIEVVTIASPDDASTGVVVVAVPPSAFAPHMVGDHYPVRRGPTTAFLSETEVARLYERRGAMLREDSRSPGATIREAFVPPIGDDGRPDPGTTLTGDVGRMRMVFLPIGPVAHPRAPWLREALRDAYERAAADVLAFVSETRPIALTRLATWAPYEGLGWSAGKSTSDPLAIGHSNPAQSSHAAVFAYPGSLSFQTTRYLRVPSGPQNGVGLDSYLCAFEQDIAASAFVFASIAGQVFADMEGVGMIHVVAELDGFADAVADGDAGARLWGAPEYSRMARAPVGYLGATMTDVAELRDEPLATGQRIADPWLAAFCEDASVWARISSSGTAS